MNALLGREPDPTSPPVRAFFKYPGFRVEYECLAELRLAMVEDDAVIIESLSNRNRRDRAVQQEYMGLGTGIFPNGFRRSFNLAHYLPDLFAVANRRHPYKTGLVDVLEQVYPEIATETSPPVQLYDFSIIDAIGARLNKAKQAVVFKRDRSEGLAPQQQEANIQRAMAIAEAAEPGNQAFVEQVERVYRALVPANVAIQQTLFDQTYLLDDWDGIGFRGIEPAVELV